MNSCCTLPLDVIAADKHKQGDECCLVTEHTSAPALAECPISHTPSRKVQKRTLEHLLKPEKLGEVRNVQYYYCADPACNLVYFSTEKAPSFTIDDMKVRVFAKDKDDLVNVCYCFDWTRGRIRDQIKQTGRSTAGVEIAREVKAQRCECDIKNPKGECCLGDVNAVVKGEIAAIRT